MTSYASHVAAVPGPPFLILACALPVVAWVAWRALHDQPIEPPVMEDRPRLRLVRAPYDWADDEDGAA